MFPGRLCCGLPISSASSPFVRRKPARAHLVDPGPRPLDADPSRVDTHIDDPLVDRALDGQGGDPLSGATLGSAASLVAPLLGPDVRIALPLSRRGGERLVGVAVVPLSDVRRSILRSGRVLLAFILLDAFLLVVFGSWFLSRAVVRPLDRLARAADAIASGDLDHRVPVEGQRGRPLVALFSRHGRGLEAGATGSNQVERLERVNADLARAQADLRAKLASGTSLGGDRPRGRQPLSAILGLADILLRAGDPRRNAVANGARKTRRGATPDGGESTSSRSERKPGGSTGSFGGSSISPAPTGRSSGRST
jgi:HAMP domain-containing protein